MQIKQHATERREPGGVGVNISVGESGREGVKFQEGCPRVRSLSEPKERGVPPGSWAIRPGADPETWEWRVACHHPCWWGKHGSFSLTLVLLVTSPLATVSDRTQSPGEVQADPWVDGDLGHRLKLPQPLLLAPGSPLFPYLNTGTIWLRINGNEFRPPAAPREALAAEGHFLCMLYMGGGSGSIVL